MAPDQVEHGAVGLVIYLIDSCGPVHPLGLPSWWCWEGTPLHGVGQHSAACRGSKIMVSNLVDSASSHTLVSKIKPCMSKYKYLTLKLRTAHYISYNLFDSPLLLG